MMGSHASGGDPLTGMISMLSDPKAFTAKMVELKEAREANEKSLTELHKAQAAAVERDKRASARESDLDARTERLEQDEINAGALRDRLDAQADRLKRLEAEIEKDRQEVVEAGKALAAQAARQEEAVRAAKAADAARATNLLLREDQLDQREADLQAARADVDEMASEYRRKLAALKAITG